MIELRRKRLKEWFDGKTLPEKEKSYLSQLINGKASFGEKAAKRLEGAYGMPADYLVNPVKMKKEESNVSYAGPYEPKGSYPVLSWVSAGNWAEAIEPYHRKSIDRWYETTVDCSDDSFWLDVKGDSMTAPAGLSVPEGMVILIDPEVEAINGKLVVAKIENENEATFKKLVIDAGNKYLKPLNPQYSMIPINGNCRIIGVVVDAKIANLP